MPYGPLIEYRVRCGSRVEVVRRGKSRDGVHSLEKQLHEFLTVAEQGVSYMSKGLKMPTSWLRRRWISRHRMLRRIH